MEPVANVAVTLVIYSVLDEFNVGHVVPSEGNCVFVVQAYRLNRASAELARKAADDVTKQSG